MEICRQYRSLVYFVANPGFKEFYNKLEELLGGFPGEIGIEFEDIPEGTERQHLHNFKSITHLHSENRGNHHLYVSIRAVILKNHICSWVIFVSHCFILRSSGLKT